MHGTSQRINDSNLWAELNHSSGWAELKIKLQLQTEAKLPKGVIRRGFSIETK